MTGFLTYWISKAMESDAEREAKLRERLSKTIAGAEKLKARWDMPMLPPGYWNTRQHMAVSKGRHAEANAAPINPYECALEDIAEARRRKQAAE